MHWHAKPCAVFSITVAGVDMDSRRWKTDNSFAEWSTQWKVLPMRSSDGLVGHALAKESSTGSAQKSLLTTSESSFRNEALLVLYAPHKPERMFFRAAAPQSQAQGTEVLTAEVAIEFAKPKS